MFPLHVHVLRPHAPGLMGACAGRCSYTNWTSTARECDDFFSDRNAIDLYKNHVKKVLTRVNTVTGLTYGSDPTIFGARFKPRTPSLF